MASLNDTGFLLHFRSLFETGRDFAFPCDAQGGVNLDQLSERARNNYFYARAVMGRELAFPDVRRQQAQPAIG